MADLKHLQGKQVPPPGVEGRRPPDTCRPLCAGSGTAPTREAPLGKEAVQWAGRGAHPSVAATGSRTRKWTRGAERADPPRAGLGSGCGREKMQRQMRWEVRLGWERLGAHGFAWAVRSVAPQALLLL